MLKIQDADSSDEKNNTVKIQYLKRIENINSLLNELNIELHKAIREEDESFVSRTMIDMPQYFYQNCVILRAITINPLTTPEILKEIIEQQNKIGLKIYKTFFSGRFDKL
jgi:glutamate decarboxylase